MAVFELILCIIAAVVVSSFASRFVPKVSTPLVQIVLGVLVTYLPFFPDATLDPELFMVLFIAPLLYLEAHEIDKSALLKTLDLGLEDRLTAKVGLLSGGQRQALTLLMASLKQPKLLLLDEHTAALDPKTADKVLALSDQIVQENNLTTLMITHNMKDAIAHGNRLIMMDAGRVVVDISGEDKKKLTVPDLLALFSRASGSDEANDKMLLS